MTQMPQIKRATKENALNSRCAPPASVRPTPSAATEKFRVVPLSASEKFRVVPLSASEVREARSTDADFIVNSNCLMAIETEGLTLDRPTVERGVAAILGDSTKGRYFIATVDDRPVGQLMITFEWSDWRN